MDQTLERLGIILGVGNYIDNINRNKSNDTRLSWPYAKNTNFIPLKMPKNIHTFQDLSKTRQESPIDQRPFPC